VVRLHPKTVNTYVENMQRVLSIAVGAAKEGFKNTPEVRHAVRMMVDSIVVHPTAKRMPYEISPYVRLGAVLGMDLFPAKRSAEQIVTEHGVSGCSELGNPAKSVSS